MGGSGVCLCVCVVEGVEGVIWMYHVCIKYVNECCRLSLC